MKKERSECIIMHIKARQKYIGTSNKLLFLFLGEKVSSPLDCFLIMPTLFYADIQYEGRGL